MPQWKSELFDNYTNFSDQIFIIFAEIINQLQ